MNYIHNPQHQVIKDYYEYIQRTTRNICISKKIKEEMDIEDIQQNCFLKILESKNETYNTSFVNKTINSCVYDHIRKQNNIYFDDKDIDLLPSPHREDCIDNIILENILKKYLRSKALRIVQMRLIRYSYDEIAKEVNLSSENCRKIYQQSKDKLRAVAKVELVND